MKKSWHLLLITCLIAAALLVMGCASGQSAQVQPSEEAQSSMSAGDTNGQTDGGSDTSADGSSTTEEAGSATAETDPAGKTVIHYGYWQASLKGYLQKCKAEFEKEHPDVYISLDQTAWDDYWPQLEGAINGGSAPDVFQMNGPNINKYAETGLITPLDDYLAKSDVDLADYPRSMVTLYEVNGNHYGIPIDYDTIGLWYNKELFDAAGVDYPTSDWTWDDMVDAAAKLTDPEKGVYGISAGYADQAGFFNTVYANGGYIISADGKKSGFDQPETIEGIRMWIDLMQAGYSPSQESLDQTPDYEQFMDGKIAMLFAGDWYAVTFADPSSDFGNKCDVQYLPWIKGKAVSVIHGKANCIYARTEHPQEAWEWTEFLSGEECNRILGESGAAIPAHKEYSDLYFESFPQYSMGIFLDEVSEAVEYPHGHGAAEWSAVIEKELKPMYSGEADLDEACARIATQMDQILEQ